MTEEEEAVARRSFRKFAAAKCCYFCFLPTEGDATVSSRWIGRVISMIFLKQQLFLLFEQTFYDPLKRRSSQEWRRARRCCRVLPSFLPIPLCGRQILQKLTLRFLSPPVGRHCRRRVCKGQARQKDSIPPPCYCRRWLIPLFAIESSAASKISARAKA